MKKLLSGKKIIFVIVGAVLVIVLGSVFLAIPMVTGSPMIAFSAEAHSSADATPAADATRLGKDASLGPGMMYPMKERIVNLADPGAFHYLKTEVVLEFDLADAKKLAGEAYKKRQDAFINEMANRRPKLDDILTTTLGAKNSAVLSTSEGKEMLRDELKAKFAEAVGEQKLVNVYFTQFIIQ